MLRTTGQLRMFADILEEGSYLEATIDSAQPQATPPRPEIRRYLRPIGPVAVFSASNFPFAFSVAGGDHGFGDRRWLPGSCEGALWPPRAVATHRRDRDGCTGGGRCPRRGSSPSWRGREAGLALVVEPSIRAVAFTGSLAGRPRAHGGHRRAARPDSVLRRAWQRQPRGADPQEPSRPAAMPSPRGSSTRSPWAAGSSARSLASCSCPRASRRTTHSVAQSMRALRSPCSPSGSPTRSTPVSRAS